MTSRQTRLTVAFVGSLVLAAPAVAAEQRHQFLEPIQPDRPRKDKAAKPLPSEKLCYCRTIHERNAAGNLTWRVICSENPSDHGARKIRAADCRALPTEPLP